MEPAKVVEAQPAAQPAPQPKPQPITPTATGQTLSGASISSLLSGSYRAAASTEGETTTESDQNVDPRSVEKLTAAKDEIISMINHERPRFIVAFENMSFEGYKIMLTVPSDSLREEIGHASTEILFKIADIAGVNGKLEFDITVKEEKRKMRPIKLEDRMAHIEKRNPVYLEFKKALELDVE